MIKIPEFILFDFVEKSLKYIREDYAFQTDKNKSYLRKILNGISFQRYDFVTQAEKVILAGVDDPRYLDVNLMFNAAREGAPSIHITLPGETPQQGGDGIGQDQGYIMDIIESAIYNQNVLVTEGKSTPIFTNRFQATYNIVITSDNNIEVIMIYHTLRAILTSLTASMSLTGLENLKFSGQDVIINQELVPVGIFIKTLNCSFQYETSAPSIYSDKIFNNIIATGKLIEN